MQNDTQESVSMSTSPRPSSADDEQEEDVHPALHPSITSIPVTPGVHLAGHSAYNQPDQAGQGTQLPFDEKATPGPQWNANSYFAPKDGPRPESPTEAAAGARSGEDLLRRLSLIGDPVGKPDLADVDPRAAHPGLNLSGGVISATFCVPYQIGYSPGLDWVSSRKRREANISDCHQQEGS